MCQPQQVHAFSCGHYVLDKPSDGCTGSRPSLCRRSETPTDDREPCRELLYELVAGGDFASSILFKGVQIMITVYRSATMCTGGRFQDEELPAAAPVAPIQAPAFNHHEPNIPYFAPPQYLLGPNYQPRPLQNPQQPNPSYGQAPVNLPVFNHAGHIPTATYSYPPNQIYNPAYVAPYPVYQTYPPLQPQPQPTYVPYGQPAMASSTATPNSSSSGPIGPPPPHGVRPKIFKWIKDKLN